MTAPTPLLPDSIQPVSIKLTSKVRTKSTKAISGKLITVGYGGQWFEATLTYPPMRRDQFGAMAAFLTSQGGKNGIFYVEIPDFDHRAHQSIGNYINHDESAFSVPDDEKYKVHMMTGAGTGSVFPAYTGQSTTFTAKTYMRCSLKRDIQEVNLEKNGLIRFSVDVIERI